MKLGILDFGTLDYSGSHAKTVYETVYRAQKAEEAGFGRYWLAEHHDPTGAWKNPSVLLGILGSRTTSIKIGAAGILLPLNSTLRVAQDFNLLGNMFPGRIDLGIAKGAVYIEGGGDNNTEGKILLERYRNHYERMDELLNFLNNSGENKNVIPSPFKEGISEIWALTVSGGAAINHAVERKICLSLSLFHTQIPPSPEIVHEFKTKFYEKHGMEATVNIAIAGACCETKKKAEEFSQIPFGFRTNIVCTKEKFFEEIIEMKERYDVDEVIVLDISPTLKDKMYSMETISELINGN